MIIENEIPYFICCTLGYFHVPQFYYAHLKLFRVFPLDYQVSMQQVLITYGIINNNWLWLFHECSGNVKWKGVFYFRA